MKSKVLFFLTSFFITSYLQAQEFAPVGAKWYFPETFFSNGNINVITNECIGDTSINNVSCRIIEKSKSSCDIPLSGKLFFYENDDQIFKYNTQTDTFNLVIDFGANVGESWEAVLEYNKFTITVDSISFFHFNINDSLRIQHVTMVDSFFWDHSLKTRIIEKIGFVKALLPFNFTSLCDSNYERPIRCYEDPNVGLITFDTVACNFTPTEDLIEFNDLEIFPNPTSELIFFRSKTLDLQSVQIFSLHGKLIREISLHQPEVNVSFLNAGIYFLKIKTDKGLVVEKIKVNPN